MENQAAAPQPTFTGRFLGRFDVHMQEVLRGASAALALKLIGAALTFLMTIVIARLLGADGAGIFFLALSVVTIASVLGKVGMDNTLLRYTAAHASQGEWGQVKGVARLGLTVALGALVIATIVVVSLAPLLAKSVFGEPALETPLRLMGLAVLPLGLFQLLAQLLRGLKRITHSVLVQSVWLPALTIAGLFVLVPNLGAEGASLAYLMGTLLTAIVGGLLWWRHTRHEADAEPFDRKALLASSRPLFAVSAMQLVLLWGSTLILGIFRSSEEVGIYSAANRTAMLLSFVLIAVNAIAAPKFAAMYKAGDLEALGSLARNSAKLMALVAFPGLLILVASPKFVLGLFGGEFMAGSLALIILACGQYVNVATGSVGFVLMMTGNEALLRLSFAVTVGINLALNLALVPLFGLRGAALASSIALAIQNLVVVVMVRRRLGIWTLPFMPDTRTPREGIL